MKTLSDILYKVSITRVIGTTGLDIDQIYFDSRKVGPGSLFIAQKGVHIDGHQFINKAIEKGATAIVCQDIPASPPANITFIGVSDSSKALGIIASNFYNNPSANLKLVGVTGTNGKTTIATLLFNLVRSLGYSAGLISTIQNSIDDEILPSTHTTPDAIQINELLSAMVNNGATYCFMEISSHSIVQNRTSGLKFTGGIFTNLTHDHLDYHHSFNEYLKAKKRFFDELPADAFALTNIDDKNGRVMVQNTKARIVTYSLKSISDYKCRIIENLLEGLHLFINSNEIWLRLVGTFNAYNILAVFASADLMGEDPTEVLSALSNLQPVVGRFDFFKSKNNITAIIDYAHTPDALLNVLRTIESIRTKNEQLITVVGAGGDRDRTKRPEMAKIAAEMSNLVILTADNPRSEDPEEIILEMKRGIDIQYLRSVIVITNRREAIKTACMMAKPGDIILVAGKGHEKYQEIKGVKYPFDDRKILEDMLLLTATNNN